MSQPFIGEIRMFAGNFAPNGWAFCNGQLVAISQNDALFSLIGTTYGGDGQTTFALPNLQSRFPMHQSTSHALGEVSGTETVTLLTQQLPQHTHVARCASGGGTSGTPVNNFWSTDPAGNTAAYTAASNAQMGNAIGATGSGQPHENMKPFLVVSFIISLFGIFPPRN